MVALLKTSLLLRDAVICQVFPLMFLVIMAGCCEREGEAEVTYVLDPDYSGVVGIYEIAEVDGRLNNVVRCNSSAIFWVPRDSMSVNAFVDADGIKFRRGADEFVPFVTDVDVEGRNGRDQMCVAPITGGTDYVSEEFTLNVRAWYFYVGTVANAIRYNHDSDFRRESDEKFNSGIPVTIRK